MAKYCDDECHEEVLFFLEGDALIVVVKIVVATMMMPAGAAVVESLIFVKVVQLEAAVADVHHRSQYGPEENHLQACLQHTAPEDRHSPISMMMNCSKVSFYDDAGEQVTTSHGEVVEVVFERSKLEE